MKEIFEQFINEEIEIKTTNEFAFKKGKRFKITGAYDKFLELKEFSAEKYRTYNCYIPYTSIYYITTTSYPSVSITLIDTLNIGEKSFKDTIANMRYNLNEINNNIYNIKNNIGKIKNSVNDSSSSTQSIIDKLDSL